MKLPGNGHLMSTVSTFPLGKTGGLIEALKVRGGELPLWRRVSAG